MPDPLVLLCHISGYIGSFLPPHLSGLGTFHHSKGDALATSSCFNLQGHHQEAEHAYLSFNLFQRHLLQEDSSVRLPCSDFCCFWLGGIARVTKDSEWQLKSGLCHQASKDDKVKRKEKSPLEKSIKTLAAQI